jgi:hypothetical protein
LNFKTSIHKGGKKTFCLTGTDMSKIIFNLIEFSSHQSIKFIMCFKKKWLKMYIAFFFSIILFINKWHACICMYWVTLAPHYRLMVLAAIWTDCHNFIQHQIYIYIYINHMKWNILGAEEARDLLQFVAPILSYIDI